MLHAVGSDVVLSSSILDFCPKFISFIHKSVLKFAFNYHRDFFGKFNADKPIWKWFRKQLSEKPFSTVIKGFVFLENGGQIHICGWEMVKFLWYKIYAKNGNFRIKNKNRNFREKSKCSSKIENLAKNLAFGIVILIKKRIF